MSDSWKEHEAIGQSPICEVWSRPSLNPRATWPLVILVILAVVAVRLLG